METAGRFVVAMMAAVLPRRSWPEMERHLPVRQAAAMSGIATFVVGMAIGIPAYFHHVETTAGRAVDLALESAGWRPAPPGAAPVSESQAQAEWVSSYLSPATFVLSPIGMLALYLVFTGGFRAVAATMDDARGDPALTIVDAIAVGRRQRRERHRAIETRLRLEGPELADRILSGAAAGLPEAEVVVIASRRKAGWEAGAFVITTETWYRLGRPVERETPNGLRTLYPLTEIHDREVLRKGVRYEFPRTGSGSGSFPTDDQRPTAPRDHPLT